MANIGYARVSTDEQNLDLQIRALQQAGADKIFEDRVSGTTRKRSGLNQALRQLKAGDNLMVWKLDRLGRSLPHLIEIISSLGDRRIGFMSLSEAINTTTAGGKLVFHIMGALAEFERSLISERTKAGMQAARERGATMGRPKMLGDEDLMLAREMLADGVAKPEIAHRLKVSPSTLYRALRRHKG